MDNIHHNMEVVEVIPQATARAWYNAILLQDPDYEVSFDDYVKDMNSPMQGIAEHDIVPIEGEANPFNIDFGALFGDE
ncbi:hypothetical protein K0U07_03595 [bacterium]|nr:hypothetical protein [bacterium]